jgi:hypothetical protein
MVTISIINGRHLFLQISLVFLLQGRVIRFSLTTLCMTQVQGKALVKVKVVEVKVVFWDVNFLT